MTPDTRKNDENANEEQSSTAYTNADTGIYNHAMRNVQQDAKILALTRQLADLQQQIRAATLQITATPNE